MVVFDSGVDSSNYVTFVATNNYRSGANGARKLAQLLNGKGHYRDRRSMRREAHPRWIAKAASRTRWRRNSPPCASSPSNTACRTGAKGMAVTENMLTAHPDLDGLFASSEPSSVGAAQALKSRGLAGKMKFVAFDSSEGLVEDLSAGVIDALVAQDPFKIGYEGVRAVTDKLDGKSPEKKIDLSATVITKADLDKPDIKRLLHPDL